MLQQIAFAMQVMKDKIIIQRTDYYNIIVNKEDRSLLEHSSLFFKNNNEYWQFEHNNIREYLAAKYLSNLELKDIKLVLCYDNECSKIRDSWINILSYLVNIYDKQDLMMWLIECSPELFVKFEHTRINSEKRNEIFIKIFNFYAEKNMYITKAINSMDELVSFGQSKDTLEFLINQITQKSNKWAKTNAIKLISAFKYLFSIEELVRNTLLDVITDANNSDYIRGETIKSIAILGIQTEDTTKVIFKQCQENKFLQYSNYSVVFYIIKCDIYDKYICQLLKIQDDAIKKNQITK